MIHLALLVLALALGFAPTPGATRSASAQPVPTQPAPAPAVSPLLVKYPELIVVNGKVVTVDERLGITQAVAVRDGRILAVGTSDEIRALAGPATRVIDAGGRTVIPGLIDSHLHMLRAGFRWSQEVRVDEARTLAEILDAIRARTREVPPGTWILVLGGWHPSQIKERRMPTREELDRIAPDHPVHVQALYDVAQMNTAAIKASGITGATPNPPGGVLEKDAQGNFTGVVRGFAGMRLVETKIPAPSFADKIEGLRRTMRDMNASGLTGVIEPIGGGVTDDDYDALFELWRRHEMTMRVALNIHANDAPHALGWIKHLQPRFGDDMLRVLGMGEIVMWPMWDGSLPKDFPIAQQTKLEFQKVVEAAARKKITLQLHATIEPVMNTMLDVIEEANRHAPVTDLRFAFIHAEQITPRIIERMKRLGMGVLIQDRQIVSSDRMRANWGARADDAPAIKTVLESGLPVAGGTDGTVATPFRPFMSLWWFVSGKNWRGDVVRPTQKISREDALRLYTRNAGWFTFETDRGAIVPGFLGDLLVLDRDYLTVPEDEIRFIRPVVTIVGGKVVWEAAH